MPTLPKSVRSGHTNDGMEKATMCMECRPGADQGIARRAHILRLLALLEHPDALHPQQALCLGKQLLDTLSGGGSLRCDSVVPAAPAGETVWRNVS
jgi:hypothetical protein